MKRCALILAALFFCACADEPQPSEQPQEGGGLSPGAGNSGGGEVALGNEGPQAREDPYTKALEHIRAQDWDSARAELLKTLEYRLEPEQQKDVLAKLKAAERGIASRPAEPITKLLSDKKFYDQRVSIRGKFISGGEVGYATQYFWVDDLKRLQCRYSKMPLSDKKAILSLKEGAKVLVRGLLKSPWGSNPDPYLEAEFLQVEQTK
ncbi:MAG: hypothetical protein HY922_06020 [Elusimicrobia bacterium]|nr:hypothetical protein [Elusimicrobiota bacterium]